MRQYYIEVDTYWQNSTSYFVGPFASKAEASAWYQEIPNDANVWLSTSNCGGDICDAWRIYPDPLTAAEAKRHGLCDMTEIDPSVSPTARALRVACQRLERDYA